jgi:hypothetical protein
MRKTPLKRKTPLRGNPDKIKAWKDRSRSNLPMRSKKRASQERVYCTDRHPFLREQPICPVTGEATTDLHHSARRHGEWINIKRYWIALSHRAHMWVENNARRAEEAGLMVRLPPSLTAMEHLADLHMRGIDPDVPIFYKNIDLYKSELKLIRNEINRSTSR